MVFRVGQPPACISLISVLPPESPGCGCPVSIPFRATWQVADSSVVPDSRLQYIRAGSEMALLFLFQDLQCLYIENREFFLKRSRCPADMLTLPLLTPYASHLTILIFNLFPLI